MLKFQIGDEVKITAGREKGKKGKVEKVLPKESKVVVGGINVYKRHKKVTRTQPAGIYEITRPISIASVSLLCPKCGKQTRVGFTKDGKTKNRICKKCKSRITVKE